MHEIIGWNFNDAKKSEQSSKETRKKSESNSLGVWGQTPSRRRPTLGFRGRAPNAKAIFPAFSKK